jgi:hypothetical protein
MSMHTKPVQLVAFSAMVLIVLLLASGCTGIPPAPSAHAAPVTATIIPGTPAVSHSTTVHGTVSDLHRMNCPCFTLVTDTGNLTVWYDLMVSPDGTRLPGVSIDALSDGMEIQVTGIRQDGGKFWATAISMTRP